ncbi:MAG: sel1 repeat family protein [Muribaculaceae bacterium]|nr:sel1 repeat family protein [Muribaculaceae bacterium]
MKKVILILSIVLLGIANVSAATPKKAAKKTTTKRTATAPAEAPIVISSAPLGDKTWMEKADAGDALAQAVVAYCYYDGGCGLPEDYAKALSYAQKSADQNCGSGFYVLGALYKYGYGVGKDEAKGKEFYTKAFNALVEEAKSDELFPQYLLGLCHCCGLGVAKSNDNGLPWIRGAAEKGFALAQNYLGRCYQNGWGVTKSETEAVEWYKKAAAQGLSWGANNLADMYYNGNGVAKSYTEAVKWYKKAAQMGNGGAANSVGNMYYSGEGVAKSYTEAVKWYKIGTDLGNGAACRNYASMYEDGEGVKKDYSKALSLYEKAAALGNEKAKDNIAKLNEKKEAESLGISEKRLAGVWYGGQGNVDFNMTLKANGQCIVKVSQYQANYGLVRMTYSGDWYLDGLYFKVSDLSVVSASAGYATRAVAEQAARKVKKLMVETISNLRVYDKNSIGFFRRQ